VLKLLHKAECTEHLYIVCLLLKSCISYKGLFTHQTWYLQPGIASYHLQQKRNRSRVLQE